ncbi:50S ribosomal protein L9 [Robertkochia solimangrovi]|uniref:50S ribosomal protein L9 n=1 Tax=Robertkochia solimangrovi TaxID=2213046 RepID=UPI001180A286|nr:50S ribosomal protein L9 [Robertkochia solimangrovi]TRZ43630.1 50S ribosomal protein L9 [Robertkochia solimangrovi]
MELILKKDVDNLGFKDDVVTVKNGYGRNYLIPQGFAVLATASAKKVLAENLKQRAFKEKKIVEDAQKVAAQLKELDTKITAKTGSGNKLFGSVTDADLAEAIRTEGNVEIEKKFISIKGGNVKVAGKYEAVIRLHREVIVDFPFEVVAEAK